MSKSLDSRIDDGSARIGVMGLGYTGLPLARAFLRAGYSILGFDVDAAKVDALNRSEPYLLHLRECTEELCAAERFEPTADAERLSECDAVFLCVPTPLDARRRPDLTFVRASVESIARVMRPGCLVVLTSTTFPGTTRDIVLPLLESEGRRADRDFHVAYSPEREDPGRERGQVPRLVGGTSRRSTELAHRLVARAYDQVCEVASSEVAEASKLFENVYRAVNIALVNELKGILEGLDVDVWDVLDAAETKTFGFQRFDPGPGMGGHCIPIDPFYLAHAAERAGREARFVELAGLLNREMPERVASRTREALERRGTPIEGARILILGLAYKRDVGDVRESPAFPLMARLSAQGATVEYSDPWVPAAPAMREWGDPGKSSVELSAESIASFDALVLITDHAAFDLDLVSNSARLVIDTRGALRSRMAGDARYIQA